MKPTEIGEARLVKADRLEQTWHLAGNPVAQAEAIQRLMKSGGLGVREVAAQLGMGAGQVVKRLSLLELDPLVVEKVRTGELGPAKAYQLSRLSRRDQSRLVGGARQASAVEIEAAVRRRVLSRQVMVAVAGSDQAPLVACGHCGGTGRVASVAKVTVGAKPGPSESGAL